ADRASAFNVVFHPSVDVFVAEGFSLGGFAGISYGRSTGYVGPAIVKSTSSSVGFGGWVGFNLRLGALCSLWPKVGLFFSAQSHTQHFPSGTFQAGGD